MKPPKYLIYFLCGIIPYILVKLWEKKFLNQNEIEEIKNSLELRGGNSCSKLARILRWLKHVLKTDLAARIGLTGFVFALIYNDEMISTYQR